MISKTTGVLFLAMFSLVGLTVPTAMSQTVFATTFLDDAVAGTDLDGFFEDGEDGGDVTEEDNQENEQEIEQEQEQDLEQDIDQSQENNQANTIETGDNTAAIEQDIANVADDVRASAGSESSGDDGSSSSDALINFGQDVVNDATINQDSSADDNQQTNFNEFGDQDALNVGVQDQDQRAANLAANLDLNVDLDEEVPVDGPDGPDGPDGDGVEICVGPTSQSPDQQRGTTVSGLTEEQASALEDALPPGQIERGACAED